MTTKLQSRGRSAPPRPEETTPNLPTRFARAVAAGPFVASAFTAALRLLGRSCRVVERRGEAPVARRLLAGRQPVIFAAWHNRILPTLHDLSIRFAARGVTFTLLVDAGPPGELLARMIRGMGGLVVRGPRLSELAANVAAGCSAGIAVDGPRGPVYRVHPGVVRLAQRTGAPVVPVTVGVRRAVRLRSWDRFMLPLPGSALRVLYGEPIFIPADAGEFELELCRRQVQASLFHLTAEADYAVVPPHEEPAPAVQP